MGRALCTVLLGLLGPLCLPALAAEPVTVELWHSYRGTERDALERAIQDFNTTHAELRVAATFVPSQSFADKLNMTVPRGNGPDVFIFAHDRVGAWADSGIIAPLDGYLTPGLLDRFIGKTVDPLRYRRQVWGLPTAFKSAVLYYNKALVPEPPQDTQALEALARGLAGRRAADGQPIFGLVWQASLLYMHAGFLHGFKGRLFDAQQNLALDGPENAASLEFVRHLVRDLKLCPEDVDSIKVTSLFNAGRAAMVLNGPWFRAEIDPAVDYGVALMPVLSPTGLRARPFVGSEAFLLSAQARRPAEAFQVMEWLTRDEAARVRMRVGLQSVANLALYQEGPIDPVLAVFREQLEYAEPMLNTPEMGMLWVPFGNAINDVIIGRATPAQALAVAQQQVSFQIQEFRKGETLKSGGGGGEAAFVQAITWGLGGALLALLGVAAVLWRRFRRGLGEAWRQRSAYAYIAPAMIGTAVLIFIPFLVGLGLSFFSYYQGDYYYVGFKNFGDILSSRGYSLTDTFSFYYKLFITVLWTATNVLLHLGIGLGLALLLKDPLLRLKGLYRALLIIPWAVPSYITAIVWRGMFDAENGVINHMFGLTGFNWWGSTWSAFLANLVANCWLGFPFMMVVSLGALQSIPQELYEAADVDGATRWQKFRFITLPLLKPALFPAVILGVIWTFNMFNVIYLVSRGAPNGGTDILVVEAFRWAFERGDRYGYAAAYSTLIFAILFLYTLITNRITRATEGAFD
ncbi:MAG TPA: extracellular solute-binding protein [Myxococcota bacterium]|nr:extracellular solute-binding protein [Myxococcota bacterium]HRY93523.1 extracellular solute-binding protein [Myxococcota bacterium]HSA20544.1 extracellular solute-binding protein [Myxococcota bacterium]